MKRILVLIMLLVANSAYAQLTFDRSRVVFDASTQSTQSFVINNASANTTYLAQTWIENDKGEKIVTPLAALPVLQRIDPNQSKQVKISLIGDTSMLSEDRETMLFLNILGIPPKGSTGNNQMDIVIKSKLKLFYRPKGLARYVDNGWIDELTIKRESGSILLENPTAYYSVIYAFIDANNRVTEKEINLKPFSSERVNVRVGNNFAMMLLNDQGVAVRLNFTCNDNICYSSREAIRRPNGRG